MKDCSYHIHARMMRESKKEIEKLQAEISRLQSLVDHNAAVCQQLEAENKRLKDQSPRSFFLVDEYKRGLKRASEVRTSGLDEVDMRPAHEAFKLGQEAMAQAIRALTIF